MDSGTFTVSSQKNKLLHCAVYSCLFTLLPFFSFSPFSLALRKFTSCGQTCKECSILWGMSQYPLVESVQLEAQVKTVIRLSDCCHVEVISFGKALFGCCSDPADCIEVVRSISWLYSSSSCSNWVGAGCRSEWLWPGCSCWCCPVDEHPPLRGRDTLLLNVILKLTLEYFRILSTSSDILRLKHAACRDFGFGILEVTAQAPVQMLQDAADLLKPGGLVYATHWRPVGPGVLQ